MDVTLKGENTIDGKKALENAAQEAGDAKKRARAAPTAMWRASAWAAKTQVMTAVARVRP